MRIRHALGPTSMGWTFVARTDLGICAVLLLDDEDPSPALARLRAKFPGAEPVDDAVGVGRVIPRLDAYLDGDDPCDDLPLDLRGTPFQRRVWEALRTIPRGQTRSYGAMASALGVAGAARAVGSACGANSVAMLVPCHRVIAADGSLGGFYWSLDRKRALLHREGVAV